MARHSRMRLFVAFGSALALGGAAQAAVVAHATYLGGRSDEAERWFGGVTAIARDAAGNVYLTGTTRSDDFPTTPGADRTLDGSSDVFVTKISPSGAILYSTLLGGPCEDWARDIAVDAAGNAYVTGRANAGVCWSLTGLGVLVAKLDPRGDLVWKTVLGGSLADTSIGHAIAVDAGGHAYVTGVASSASHDFPTTAGAYRTTECANVHWYAGDAFVATLAPDGRGLVWSTYLCGGGDDSPGDIAVDATGHVYVVGTTGSNDFPTRRAIQDTRRGGPVSITGFATKLAPDGRSLAWSTYLGGEGNSWLNAVAVDAAGNAYVTGETDAVDFPTTPGVLQPQARTRHCIQRCTDAVVAKIPAGSGTLAWSTYLAGEFDEAGYGIAVERDGSVVVVGGTASRFLPIVEAFQAANKGLLDGFVAKLAPGGARLLWSSYLGGSAGGPSPRTGWDRAASVVLDGAGGAWVAGYTQSYDLPTTPDAAQPQLGSEICDFLGTPCGDVFVARIADAPAPVPPVRLVTAPGELAPGGALVATWTGLPAPGSNDQLQLFELGSAGDLWNDRVISWATTGAAAGTLTLQLPADLPPGWYELRLVVPDPNFGNLPAAIARSAPLRVTGTAQPPTQGPATPTTSTTSTTLPGGAACGPDACDDGDPCTADACLGGGLCASSSLEGMAGVVCACGRSTPAACAADGVPAAVARRRDRACALVADAATTANNARARRRLRQAGKTFAAAARVAARGRGVARDCGAALAAELRDARARTVRLLRAN